VTDDRAEPAQVREALLAIAAIGPFFEFEVLGEQARPGWLPAEEVYRRDMPGLVERTALRLGTDQARVAASILHLGIAARLWSPVLGCALLYGIVPDVGSLVVNAGPPVALGVTELSGWLVTSPAQAAAASTRVVSRELAVVAAMLPARLAVGLLRGNSASAMAGALGELVRARPGPAAQAATLASELLQTSELSGGGVLTATAPLAFRRRSCCLYYRVPGADMCGDCCLDRAPER
jgi:hypothetical protein